MNASKVRKAAFRLWLFLSLPAAAVVGLLAIPTGVEAVFWAVSVVMGVLWLVICGFGWVVAALFDDSAREQSHPESTSNRKSLPDSTAESRPANFCPSCGERIDPTWRFCSHCRAELS